MIILINGTSSSGKTAVAKELQEVMGGAYFLNFSIDSILYGLPPSALKRMTTGQKNPGLSYTRLEEGFYKCARTLADVGHDLIVDNAIVTARSARLLVESLDGLPVWMIGLSCGTGELRRRELQRGDRTVGEAESQVELIHKYCSYDLELDSTTTPPSQLARMIHSHVTGSAARTGFQLTKAQLQEPM